MANLNGQIILDALQILGRPATFHEIVVCIADTPGVLPDVREPIQENLNAGVRYGFIQRENRRYTAVRVPAAVVTRFEEAKKEFAKAEAENNGEEKKGNNEDDELKKKSKRRKGGKKKRAAARRRAAPRR